MSVVAVDSGELLGVDGGAKVAASVVADVFCSKTAVNVGEPIEIPEASRSSRNKT